jgi:flagellar protein FliS
MNWKTAYLETRVMSADPVELINILYEYATLRVQEARTALAQGEISNRSKAITSAIAILAELNSSLDHNLGGEIAANLARLYRYMTERLTLANLKRADEPLAEVERLLKTLGEAWQTIAREKNWAQTDTQIAKTQSDWGALSMLEAAPDYNAHAWSV